MKLPMHRTLVARLTGLFALLLMLFAAGLGLAILIPGIF